MQSDEDVNSENAMKPDVMPPEPRGINAPVIRKKGLSRDSIKTLERINFDPIQRMVMLYNEVTRELYHLTHNEDDSRKEKYSTVLHASLLTTKQKIINDLLRYGYTAPVERVSIEHQNKAAPLTIKLTKQGDVFQADLKVGAEPIDREVENEASDYSVDSDSVRANPLEDVPEIVGGGPIRLSDLKIIPRVPEGFTMVELSETRSAYSKDALLKEAIARRKGQYDV